MKKKHIYVNADTHKLATEQAKIRHMTLMDYIDFIIRKDGKMIENRGGQK